MKHNSMQFVMAPHMAGGGAVCAWRLTAAPVLVGLMCQAQVRNALAGGYATVTPIVDVPTLPSQNEPGHETWA